jgi:hypothetical protein
LLFAVLHQALELGERLLDLGHSTRAVDELALLGIELVSAHYPRRPAHLHVRDDETEERHGLACPRGHLKHTVALLSAPSTSESSRRRPASSSGRTCMSIVLPVSWASALASGHTGIHPGVSKETGEGAHRS